MGGEAIRPRSSLAGLRREAGTPGPEGAEDALRGEGQLHDTHANGDGDGVGHGGPR